MGDICKCKQSFFGLFITHSITNSTLTAKDENDKNRFNNCFQQFTNPTSLKPPLKFGTVPWTYTEEVIRKKFPDMHLYMKQYNREGVMDGINSVKRG